MASELRDNEQLLARAVLMELQPDEARVFETLLQKPKWWSQRSDSVGYGLESVNDLLSPYVIVATAWASSVVLGETKRQVAPRVQAVIRRIFKHVPGPGPTEEFGSSSPLTEAILQEKVQELAESLGMKSKKARRLAAAVARAVLEQQKPPGE